MFKNAKVIAFFTLISRLFGYIRDLFIANYFGATIYSDMFFIAFRIPNSLRRFLGEGAVNSSVVPVISKIEDKDKPQAIWNIIIIFAVLLVVVSLLGVLFSKVLIYLFALGFLHSDKFIILNNMVKITFPYIFFIGLSVLLMGILNTYNRFAIPAFAPTLLNISIIGSIIVLMPLFKTSIYALCAGVLIGGLLQLMISMYDFIRLKIPFSFRFTIEPSTKEIFKLMGITALGGGIFQISSMVDVFLASFMHSGSFSYISYANRLFQLPFAVFSIAITQSSLVDLSKVNKDDVLKSSFLIVRLVSIISVSVTLYFLFFGWDVIGLLFKHGKFDLVSQNNTYYALSLMIIGFFFFSQSKILSNIFFASKDAETPLKASSLSALAAIISSVVFGILFGFKGLALSMSIAGFVNMVLLLWFINKEVGSLPISYFMDLRVLFLSALLVVFSLSVRFLRLDSYINVLIATMGYLAIFMPFYKLTAALK